MGRKRTNFTRYLTGPELQQVLTFIETLTTVGVGNVHKAKLVYDQKAHKLNGTINWKVEDMDAKPGRIEDGVTDFITAEGGTVVA